jgi:predicted transcriptional regulator
MSRNNKYMDIYRRFESAVKKNGFLSIKAYEESFFDDKFKQEQIRICRLIRNYIEHERTDFVEATDNMISFLEKETVALDESEMPVKRKMISIKNAIRDTDLIVIAADFMAKKKVDLIPVFDKSDFAAGALSSSDIVKYIASGDFTKAKKVSTVQVAHKFGFINEDAPMKQVRPMLTEHKKIYLVLNDSKKVVGWII